MFTVTHALSAVAIAAAYAAWSITGKWLGLPGSWVTIIVMVGTFAGAVTPSVVQARAEGVPAIGPAILLLMIALANGWGVYSQSMKVMDKTIPTIPFITTIIVSMVVFTTVYDWALNAAPITWGLLIGAALAVAGVVIMCLF